MRLNFLSRGICVHLLLSRCFQSQWHAVIPRSSYVLGGTETDNLSRDRFPHKLMFVAYIRTNKNVTMRIMDWLLVWLLYNRLYWQRKNVIKNDLFTCIKIVCFNFTVFILILIQQDATLHSFFFNLETTFHNGSAEFSLFLGYCIAWVFEWYTMFCVWFWNIRHSTISHKNRKLSHTQASAGLKWTTQTLRREHCSYLLNIPRNRKTDCYNLLYQVLQHTFALL